jgi:hypothetical protein
MEENTLKNLWQSSTEKLEINFTENINSEKIMHTKVQSLLSTMKPLKIFTIIFGILWIVFGSIAVVNLFFNHYESISKYFLYSASLQLLLTAAALVFYIYQLAMIYSVDVSGPILKIQIKLASLKSSTFWIARMMFLQLPLWTTFYLSDNIFNSKNYILLGIQCAVTTIFTGVAIYLLFNIKYENKDKKWFRLIFAGKEWQPIIDSMELYKESVIFEKE